MKAGRWTYRCALCYLRRKTAPSHAARTVRVGGARQLSSTRSGPRCRRHSNVGDTDCGRTMTDDVTLSCWQIGQSRLESPRDRAHAGTARLRHGASGGDSLDRCRLDAGRWPSVSNNRSQRRVLRGGRRRACRLAYSLPLSGRDPEYPEARRDCRGAGGRYERLRVRTADFPISLCAVGPRKAWPDVDGHAVVGAPSRLPASPVSCR